jgi:hypothetical protein
MSANSVYEAARLYFAYVFARIALRLPEAQDG